MTPRKRKGRIYWRVRGGERRAYGDFRNLGGGREALRAPGEKLATTDPDVAAELAARRVRELTAANHDRVLFGASKPGTLGAVAAQHLVAKAQSGRYTVTWLSQSEAYLRRVLGILGHDRDLRSVRVEDVRRLIAHLRALPNGRGGTMSDANIHHHLSALSGVFQRAASEGFDLPREGNPIRAMLEKPRAKPKEARWLEPHDAALLLEAARLYQAREGATPFIYPLLATFLLTGARETEVYGLELDDIQLERRTLTLRDNQWRRLKTPRSNRVLRLWPQLHEILTTYLRGPHRPTGELLFPSMATGAEAMLTDTRKLLDHVAARAGWTRGEIRTRMFRHGYAAARLQTLDHGAPVSLYTVSRELGHSSQVMVEKTYSHLGEIRMRSEVVEYRIEQHRARLVEQVDVPER